MERANVDEYLKQGMYGAKQTKPDERRRFLGTLRERTVAALTQKEVLKKQFLKELETILQTNQKAHLYLNGNLEYAALSDYIKLAQELNVEYTIVTNKDYDSDLGLVLAHSHAVDKEEIFLGKKMAAPQVEAASSKTGLPTLIGKLFKRKKPGSKK